jgi:hypothetical protein
MARSIPARNCSPLPPAARNGSFDEDTAVLNGFDAVGDLDKLARCGIGIG